MTKQKRVVEMLSKGVLVQCSGCENKVSVRLVKRRPLNRLEGICTCCSADVSITSPDDLLRFIRWESND